MFRQNGISSGLLQSARTRKNMFAELPKIHHTIAWVQTNT